VPGACTAMLSVEIAKEEEEKKKLYEYSSGSVMYRQLWCYALHLL